MSDFFLFEASRPPSPGRGYCSNNRSLVLNVYFNAELLVGKSPPYLVNTGNRYVMAKRKYIVEGLELLSIGPVDGSVSTSDLVDELELPRFILERR